MRVSSREGSGCRRPVADSNMIWKRIEQLLGTGRWLPYQLGAVMSLPFAAAFMASWEWSANFYILWCLCCPFWAGLDVFRRTPLRKDDLDGNDDRNADIPGVPRHGTSTLSQNVSPYAASSV